MGLLISQDELVGKRFGMLVVLRVFRDGGISKMECICDCGSSKIANVYYVKTGDTKSCGCLRSKTFNETFTKHGNAKNGKPTKVYTAWRSMLARCRGNHSQKYYLEKGISISPEWVDDFAAFLAHIGNAPTSRHSLDRIDNSRGYQPGNVRWATAREQARNRDNSIYVTVDGVRLLLVEAAEKYSITANTIRNRLAKGWSDEAAVKTTKAARQRSAPQRSATRPIERNKGI